MPRAARAPATCRLFLRQHHRAFRLTGVTKVERNAIGRVDLEKMIDAFSEQAALQPLPQHVRRQNVRHLLQKVPGVLLALRAHTEFSQPIDPAPHRRPRHADLPRNPCAANHDRRVFREQGQQRRQPPIGGSGERIGLCLCASSHVGRRKLTFP